jgi:SHS2 domain-containing protein
VPDPRLRETENYFDHDADIGIIGRGESLEICFASAAYAMFSLMADITNVHQIQIITFEFEETDVERALVTWLNLLLAKSKEHNLIFGDFRIKLEEKLWKAIVAGEPLRPEMVRGVEVKGATVNMLSVNKINHQWEARCVVDV